MEDKNNDKNNIEDNLSWELIEASVSLDNKNEEGGYLNDKYHIVKATFPKSNLKDGFYKVYNEGGNAAKLSKLSFCERVFLVNSRTREVFAAYVDDSYNFEKDLMDAAPLREICAKSTNNDVASFSFNIEPVKSGETSVKAESIPKLYNVLTGKEGFEIELDLLNIDFSQTGDDYPANQGEQFDFDPDNTDEDNNDGDGGEERYSKFVVSSGFVKNFDNKGIDGCLFDIKGASALKDSNSKNKYKKIFVSTTKKMYYVNDDNHIVGDIGENEVALETLGSNENLGFVYDNNNLSSKIEPNHELRDYEIELLEGEIPEELKKALLEPKDDFGVDFPVEETDSVLFENGDNQPQTEPENDNNNNESQEEPNEQQKNQNLNNKGELGMAEKKTKLIISDDIKYIKNGDDPAKWYFEVPVSDKEVDGKPQWTSLYIRATDGVVFNNPELDEKIDEYPDKKRVQVVEEPIGGGDPKEFVLKYDSSSSFCVKDKTSGAEFLSNKIKEDKNYKDTGGYLSISDLEKYSNKIDAVSCNGEHEKDFGGFKGTKDRYIIRGHKLKVKKMFDSGGTEENLFVTQDPELKVYKVDNNNKISPDGLIGKAREMKDFWQGLRKEGGFELRFNMNSEREVPAVETDAKVVQSQDDLKKSGAPMIKGSEIYFSVPGYDEQYIFVESGTWKVYRKPKGKDENGDDLNGCDINDNYVYKVPQKFSFDKREATFKLEDDPDGTFALTSKMIKRMMLYGDGIFTLDFQSCSKLKIKNVLFYNLSLKEPGSDGEILHVLVQPETGEFVFTVGNDLLSKQKIDLKKGILDENQKDSGSVIKDLNDNHDLANKIKDAMYDKGMRIKFELDGNDEIINQKLGTGSYEFQADGYKVKATLFGKTRNLFVITKGKQDTTDRKGCIYDLDNRNKPVEIQKLKIGEAYSVTSTGTKIYDVPELYALLKEKNKLESKLSITKAADKVKIDDKDYIKIFVNDKKGANDFLLVDPITREVLYHTATKRVKINLDGSVSEITSNLFKDRFFLRDLDGLADFKKEDGTTFKDNELGRLFYPSKIVVFVEKGEKNNFDVILQKESIEYKLRVCNDGAVYHKNSRIKLGLKKNGSLELDTDLLNASSFSLRNPEDSLTEEGKFISRIRDEIKKVDPKFFLPVTVDVDLLMKKLVPSQSFGTKKKLIEILIQNNGEERKSIWVEKPEGKIYDSNHEVTRLKLKKNELSGFIEVEEDKDKTFVLTPENDFEEIAKKIEAKYPYFYKDDQEQKITFELEPQKPDKNTPAVKIFVIINGKKDEISRVYMDNTGKIFKDYMSIEELKSKYSNMSKDPEIFKNLAGFKTRITKIWCDDSRLQVASIEKPQITIEDKFFKANGFNYDDLKDYYKRVTLELDPVHPNKDTTTVKILIKVNGECKSNLRVDKNKKVFQDDNGNLGLGLCKISYTEDGLVIKTLAGDYCSHLIKQITIDDEFFEDYGIDYDALKDFFGEEQKNKITFELEPAKPDKNAPFVEIKISGSGGFVDYVRVDKNKKLFVEAPKFLENPIGKPVYEISCDGKDNFGFDVGAPLGKDKRPQITIDDKFFKDNGLDLNLFKEFFVKENCLTFGVYEKKLKDKNDRAEFWIDVTDDNETKRHYFLVSTDGNLIYTDINPIKPVKEIKFNKDTGEFVVDAAEDNRPTVNVRDKFFKDHNLDLGLFKNFLNEPQEQIKEVTLDFKNIKIENGIAKIEVFGGTKYGNVDRYILIDKNGNVSGPGGDVSGIRPDGNYMSGAPLNILNEKTNFELETTKMFKGVRKALESKGFFAKEKILEFGVDGESLTSISNSAKFWIKDNTSVNYFELFPDGSLKDEKDKKDVISIEFDSNTGNIKVDKDSSEGAENKSAFNIKNKFFKDHNLDLSMFGDFLKKDIALDFRPDEVIVAAGIAAVDVLVDGKKQDPDISLEFYSNGEVKYKDNLISGIDKNGKPILADGNNKALNILKEEDFNLETNKMFKDAETALAKLFCNKKDLEYSLSDGPYTSKSKFAKITAFLYFKKSEDCRMAYLFVDKDCKIYAKYENDQFSQPVLDVKLSEDAKEIEIIYYDKNDEHQKQLTVNDSRFKNIESKLTDFLKKETIRKLEFELIKPEKDAKYAVMKVKLVDDNRKIIKEIELCIDKKGLIYVLGENPVLEISVRDDDIYLNANKISKEIETIPLNIIYDDFFKAYNLDLSILDEFFEVGKELNFKIDKKTGVKVDDKHGKFILVGVSASKYGNLISLAVTEQGKVFKTIDVGTDTVDDLKPLMEVSEIKIINYRDVKAKFCGNGEKQLSLDNKIFDSIRDEIKACFVQKEENKIISFGEPKKTQDGKFVEIEVKLNDESQNPPVFVYSDKNGKIFSGNDRNELVKEIDKNGKIVKASGQSEQLDLSKINEGIYAGLMNKIKLSFVGSGLKVGKQNIVKDKVALKTEKDGVEVDVEVEIPRNVIKIESKGKELYFDTNTMFLTYKNGKVKLFKENNNDVPRKLIDTDEYKKDFKDIKVIKTEDGTQIDLNAPSKLEMIQSANLAYSENKIGDYELQAKIISCFGEKAFNDLSKQICDYIDGEMKAGNLKKNATQDEIKDYLKKKINMHPVWKYITSGGSISGVAGLSGLGFGALATGGALIASLGPIGFIALLAGTGVLTVGGATGFFADMYCTNRNRKKTIIIKNNKGEEINVFDKVKSKKQEKPKQVEKSTKSNEGQEI